MVNIKSQTDSIPMYIHCSVFSNKAQIGKGRGGLRGLRVRLLQNLVVAYPKLGIQKVSSLMGYLN